MKFKNKNIKQDFLAQRSLSFLLLFLLFFLMSCESEEEYPQYNPPTDHTISKEGVLHKNGLSDPTANCAACHGVDLTGGSAKVSCYECHGVKW